MPSENQVDDTTMKSVSPSPVPAIVDSRRALMRATVLAVPLVLTLTSNASAADSTGVYASAMMMMMQREGRLYPVEFQDWAVPVVGMFSVGDAAALFYYGVPVGVELFWKSWGDGSGFVVYHARTGHTHLLDELAAWVVKLLQAESLSQQSVADRLVGEFELDAPEVLRYLESLLPQLCRFGLVGASASC